MKQCVVWMLNMLMMVDYFSALYELMKKKKKKVVCMNKKRKTSNRKQMILWSMMTRCMREMMI